MEAYFMHQYPYFSFFHKALFLGDLKAGYGSFCSQILVNAILANACHVLHRTPNRFEFWNSWNPCYLFMAEVKRLLEMEGNSTRLTTVQALLILQVTIAEQGMDKAAQPYIDRAISMGKNLDIFRDRRGLQSRRDCCPRINSMAGHRVASVSLTLFILFSMS